MHGRAAVTCQLLDIVSGRRHSNRLPLPAASLDPFSPALRRDLLGEIDLFVIHSMLPAVQVPLRARMSPTSWPRMRSERLCLEHHMQLQSFIRPGKVVFVGFGHLCASEPPLSF